MINHFFLFFSGKLINYPSVLERQEFLEYHHFACRCVYCVNNVNFNEILSNVSDTLTMADTKYRAFQFLPPLTIYEEMGKTIIKTIIENREIIIKNADNPCSPEFFLLPENIKEMWHMFSHFVNFPYFLNANALQN